MSVENDESRIDYIFLKKPENAEILRLMAKNNREALILIFEREAKKHPWACHLSWLLCWKCGKWKHNQYDDCMCKYAHQEMRRD